MGAARLDSYLNLVEAELEGKHAEINPLPRRRSLWTALRTFTQPRSGHAAAIRRRKPDLRRGRGERGGKKKKKKKGIRSEQQEKSPPRPDHCSRTGRKRAAC